jgi:hypothetical protein
MAFDLSFITRPQSNEDGAANQIHQKNAGTTGTTGTAFIHAGLRVPELQNKSGTFWDKQVKPEQKGQAGQHESGAGTDFLQPPKGGDSGNLSQLVPEIKAQSGTKKPSVYAGVPLVPDVPAKKASNLNEAAKAQAWGKLQTAQLIHAAMLACDYWKDGEAARAQMQQQCQEATPAEQAELLRYFQRTYGGSQDAHK